MFERFTERARQVVLLAHEEARKLNHDYIGTEHLVLGLLREEEGLAARTLANLGVTVDKVCEQIVKRVGEGQGEFAATQDRFPFSAAARKCLELALREALSLGHNYIGTEHVLLGLVRRSDSLGAKILADLVGEDSSEKIRNEALRMLTGSRTMPKAPGPEPLTEAHIREAGLGSLHVQHRMRTSLHGVLTGYDFLQDRCTVQLDAPGISGQFEAPRSELIVCQTPAWTLRSTG